MRFIGIDVQQARGFAFASILSDGSVNASGWASQLNHAEIVEDLIHALGLPSPPGDDIAIGIDSPRCPLTTSRAWYWDGRARNWRPRRAGEKGYGRHCEVAIKAHGLANPQWTPFADDAPEWMKMGFQLFRRLSRYSRVYEVFPTASYSVIGNKSIVAQVDFANFAAGPEDMIDAYVAAVTVREFIQHRGAAVGNGDGLGAIILPRPIPEPIDEVLHYPAT